MYTDIKKRWWDFWGAALIVCLWLSGCVSIPKIQQPLEKSKNFPISFEEVWGVVNKSIVESGVNISAVQKQSGAGFIILTKSLSPAMIKDVALAPTNIAWMSGSVVIKIIVNEEDENSTQVIINIKITGFGRPRTLFLFSFLYPYTTFEMGSTGVLEKEYFNKISDALEDKIVKQSNP